MPVPKKHLLKVIKAIYGMPQAGREFWKVLRSIILKPGLIQSEHAHYFLWKRTAAGFMIIMTYVDDLTFTTVTDCNSMRAEVFAAINALVTIEDRDVLNSFPGMDFKYNKEEDYWHITQGTYTKELCASMGFHPAGRPKSSGPGRLRTAPPRTTPIDMW
jgi:hypothetical protein